MGMPPVQKAALAMLPKLAPTHLPQVGHARGGEEGACASCLHCSLRSAALTLFRIVAHACPHPPPLL